MKSFHYVALLLAAFTPVASLQANPLSLADAERRALERDAEIQALEAEADGRRDAAVASGRLPDPEVSLAAQNLPTDGFALDQEGMTSLAVGVRQRFPGGDSRALREQQGEVEADVIQARVEARRREVLRRVRHAWVAWRFSERKLALARQERQDFDELVELTRNRYQNGMGSQRDLSHARLERAAVEERLLTLREERDTARAELGRWVGSLVDVDHPGEGAIPEPDGPDDPLQRLQSHPLIRVAALNQDVAEVGVELANQSYRPDWMVEFQYGHRRAEDAGGDRLSDLATARVGFSLPLFTGERQDREVGAARARARAQHFRRMDTLHALRGRLDTALARHERRQELASLYEDQLIAEAGQRLDLEFSAFSADRGDFRDLIRARVDELDYRLRLVGVEQKLAESRIELHYLLGEEQ